MPRFKSGDKIIEIIPTTKKWNLPQAILEILDVLDSSDDYDELCYRYKILRDGHNGIWLKEEFIKTFPVTWFDPSYEIYDVYAAL